MRDPLHAYHPQVIPLPGYTRRVAFSPDGAEVAFATDGGTYVANVATRTVRKVSTKKRATFSFAGDSEVLRAGVRAMASMEGLAIVDAATGDARALHRECRVFRLALSPDGTRIVASGQAGSWEGPCEGPLAWLPEEGAVAHCGAFFAIGHALFRPEREASSGPFAWLPDYVDALDIAPAGDRLCVASRGEVRLVDVADLPARPPVGPTADVHHLAVDELRGRLAAMDNHGVVCVWSLADGKLVSAFRPAQTNAPIAWARDGLLLVGGPVLAVWDAVAALRRSVHRIDQHDEVRAIHVRDNGVVLGRRKGISVLDAAYAVRATAGPWDDTTIEQIDVSPDGSMIYVALGHDHPALAIAASDGHLVRELPASRAVAATDTLLALDTKPGSLFAQDGSVLTATDGSAPEPMERFSLATAVGDAILSVNNAVVSVRARGEPRWRTQFADFIMAVAVSRERFFSGGRALWVAERSLEDGRLRRLFGTDVGGKVIALAFDPSGTRLAVGEMEGRLHVWSLGERPARQGVLDGTILQPAGTIREPGQVGAISSLAFPGPLVACASTVMIWDGDLERIGQVEPRTTTTNADLVSRDGRRFVTGDMWGQEIAVFDDLGDALWRGPGIESRDRFSDVSDDGSLVLAGGHNDAASEISIHTDRGERVGTLRIEHSIQAVAFDSRGRVVGCLRERPTYFRWDPARGVVERWCAAPAIHAFGLDRIARGGGRIVLWGGATSYVLDEETGSLLASLPKPNRQASVTAVAVSNDGRLVALGDWSGLVRVFEIDAGARCVAVLSGTAEGGWWSTGSAGFTHVPNVFEAP